MSLTNLLENGNVDLDQSELPDPKDEDSEEVAAEMRAANAAVTEIIHKAKGKKKRGPYVIYDPKIRAQIGEHAIEHGITSACKKFSFELGKKLNESTVRAFKEAYQKQLKVSKTEKITNLPVGNRGRPPLLGSELDQRIQDYIRRLQTNGVNINRRIVLGAARGMLEQHDSSVMRENGGNIELTEKWAQSFMARMSITPRKNRKRKMEETNNSPDSEANDFLSENLKTLDPLQRVEASNSTTNETNNQQPQPTSAGSNGASAAKSRKENDVSNIEIIKESLRNIVETQMLAVEVDRQRMEIERRRAENEHQFFQGMMGMMSQIVAQMCQQQSTQNMF